MLTAGGLAALGPVGASASSHREAPNISGEPEYDNTDVYAFVSPDKASTTTLVANWFPFEEPAGGPNFYRFADDARYDIKIDNNGDAVADIIYRYKFRSRFLNGDTFLYNTGPVTSLTDPNLNFRQTYKLWRIENFTRTRTLIGKGRVAPSYVGDASMPNYRKLRNDAVMSTNRGRVKSFAGQAEDPFFLDLRVFDLLYGGDLSEVGDDTLRGFNVQTTALQVPNRFLTRGKDPVIGVWSTTSRMDHRGKWRRISRLGNPLVNEVVIPVRDKDNFNASVPKNDAQFLKYVTNPELPRLIEAIYGIEAPKTPRNDLVSVFLTGVKGLNQPKNLKRPGEMLRLNTSIKPTANPNRLGVLAKDLAGFPNGRRLTDDVVDIALQVMEGELVGNPNDLGDAVNRNDRMFGSTFPYVALPYSGSNPNPHGGGGTASGTNALNGGAYTGGGAPASEFPLMPVTALGLGLLSLLGGGLALRRNRTVRKPVTA